MFSCIVISRFNENIDWINKIIHKKWINQIIIYNKGTHNLEYLINPKIIILNVENIGREGYTYLDFIISNYDNLHDELWFIQADPFIHSPDFLNFFNLNIKLKYNKDFQNLTCKYIDNYPLNEHLTNAYNINNCRCSIFYFSKISLDIVGHNYGTKEELSKIYENETGFITQHNYGIYDNLCDRLKIKKPNLIMVHTVSACFYVHKNMILRHKKKVYQELRNYLVELNSQGGVRGYILERFWHYLFTGISYLSLNGCYKELFSNNNFVGIYNKIKKIIVFKNLTNYKVIHNHNSFVILNNNKVLPHIDILGEIISYDKCMNIQEAHNKYKVLYLKKKYNN